MPIEDEPLVKITTTLLGYDEVKDIDLFPEHYHVNVPEDVQDKDRPFGDQTIALASWEGRTFAVLLADGEWTGHAVSIPDDKIEEVRTCLKESRALFVVNDDFGSIALATWKD